MGMPVRKVRSHTWWERWLGIDRLYHGVKKPKDGYKRPNVRLARSTKDRIYAEQGGLCYICHEPMTQHGGESDVPVKPTDATWDHIQPLILGGANRLDNMALAHSYPCNLIKGQLPALDLTTQDGRDRALAFHVFIVSIHTCQPLRRVI